MTYEVRRVAILLRRPHPRKRAARTYPFFGVSSNRLLGRTTLRSELHAFQAIKVAVLSP